MIEYILARKIMRQVDIANQLNVSRAQVSKWKRGEYLPAERERQLLELAGLFGDDFQWAVLVGNEQNGLAWLQLFEHLNECLDIPYFDFAEQSQQTVKGILTTLQSIDCPIPSQPFDTSNLDYDEPWDDFTEFLFELLDIYSDLSNWINNNLFALGADYIEPIYDEAIDLSYRAVDMSVANLTADSLDTAGIDVEKHQAFAIKVKEQTRRNIRKLCQKLRAANIPIQADYFKLINSYPGELATEDEYFDFWGRNQIEYYLPFNEREVLQNARHLSKGLEELHLKLDMLLSNEQRQQLENKLEIFKPSLNPLLANQPDFP